MGVYKDLTIELRELKKEVTIKSNRIIEIQSLLNKANSCIHRHNVNCLSGNYPSCLEIKHNIQAIKRSFFYSSIYSHITPYHK
jgi:hypothetical protein